ncbi:isoprenylcysteine carboxyl methyltransferase family protein [Azospirillum picis]|uniref:Methyltransferase n=1 Tax=Azospirillum picis TaxID=488438 RepID=A0ABU0MLR0_9PROT|nr:isoprenylcysteine carboxylmethyltransferase family protein [Azospirillum picis]MBP2301018.1 methyltransferase [Azospirillum picis]MDQ0534362.1 methyltransferase [Azospirillum picis]
MDWLAMIDGSGWGLGWPRIILLAVALQRLLELVLARRNTARLLTQGAREAGAGHYPLFVVLHAGWLAALFVATPADAPANGWLLALFAMLQAGRVWVIATLGRYWTTRIITLDGAPLVRRGPFRLVRHPNYLVVAGELVVLPLVFGTVWIAVAATLLNLPLTLHRIRVEEEALRGRDGTPAAGGRWTAWNGRGCPPTA